MRAARSRTPGADANPSRRRIDEPYALAGPLAPPLGAERPRLAHVGQRLAGPVQATGGPGHRVLGNAVLADRRAGARDLAERDDQLVHRGGEERRFIVGITDALPDVARESERLRMPDVHHFDGTQFGKIDRFATIREVAHLAQAP